MQLQTVAPKTVAPKTPGPTDWQLAPVPDGQKVQRKKQQTKGGKETLAMLTPTAEPPVSGNQLPVHLIHCLCRTFIFVNVGVRGQATPSVESKSASVC